MTVQEFKSRIVSTVPVGTVFNNPGGGKSEVVKIDDEKIAYIRRNSRIYIRFSDLFSVYQRFRGIKVTTSDLKEFVPEVFDTGARPAGHDCNCTFLFLILGESSLAGVIEGEGKKGKPFACRFF